MRFGTLPGMTDNSSWTWPTTGIDADQSPRVRVLRAAEERGHVGVLDDLAGIHDGHAVAHLGDHAEVVRDQDDRGAGLVAQVAHQVEDLRLDRDVEGCRGLVGDQQLGLACQRHRDHDALGHPTGQLVRERVESPRRVGDPDHSKQLERAVPCRPALHPAVDLEDLGDLVADVPDRV